MARFIHVKTRMQRTADMEAQERLGLSDSSVEELFNPICVDLDRVVTYMHHYNSEGDVVPGFSEITLAHGGYLVIDMDFQKIDKLLRGVDKV